MSTHFERQYLDILSNILHNGSDTPDRSNVGTRFLWQPPQMRFDLSGKTFPAVTTKKLYFHSVVAELIWFLLGLSDIRFLHAMNCSIWDGNAFADYWASRARFEGDAGRIYGVQWRDWTNKHGSGIDQIQRLVTTLKKNPYSRKNIVSAWNVVELDQMSLEPCHVMFHCRAHPDDESLLMYMYQRSCDMFLGVPFNITSYALLHHILAAIVGCKPGIFVHQLGDAHIYKNHFEQVKEQLTRDPLPASTLWLNPAFFEMNSVDELNRFLGTRVREFLSAKHMLEQAISDVGEDVEVQKRLRKEWCKGVTKRLDDIAHTSKTTNITHLYAQRCWWEVGHNTTGLLNKRSLF